MSSIDEGNAGGVVRDVPKVFVTKKRRGGFEDFQFFCRYCKKLHRHSGVGHRTAHCVGTTPYSLTGYDLVLAVESDEYNSIKECIQIIKKVVDGYELDGKEILQLQLFFSTGDVNKIPPRLIEDCDKALLYLRRGGFL